MLEHSIISSRVKRLESILIKLDRMQDMQLSRMDDLAGIRVTLSDMKCLIVFNEDIDHCEILNSSKIDNTNIRTNDYIKDPKEDGYRGIHKIFKFKINKEKYVRLELQIRTEVQHEWATIVEILGTLQMVSYKTGQGEKDYRLFLKLCSDLFSIEENENIVIDNLSTVELCKKLKELDDKLGIIKKLKNINNIKQLKDHKEAKCYLLQLNLITYETKILSYNDNLEANEHYAKLEQKYQRDNKYDVVMITVENFDKIEKAYPNYFLDSNNFIKRYQRLLKTYLDSA